MQKILIITILMVWASLLNAQVVQIPDSIFKNYLVNNAAINTNNDAEIQLSEAINVDSLNLKQLGIKTLIGIEAFINLSFLDCSTNDLDSLILNDNDSLVYLLCNNNNLSALNLDALLNLVGLECRNNPIEKFDFQNNVLIKHLDCTRTLADSLSFHNNFELYSLKVGGNNTPLEYLNIDNNTNLVLLELNRSNLVEVQFPLNLSIRILYVTGENYLQLNVSNLITLEKLSVFNTSIDSLNLDYNINLDFVSIRTNIMLTYLSIKNGQNQYLNSFNTRNNSSLMCIGIDNIIYPSMNCDPWSEFNSNCPATNCKSYSYHVLPLICTYGSDSYAYSTVIDTLVNTLGCDSFFIKSYTLIWTDQSTAYDSIFIKDTLDYLQPILGYRRSYWGGPLLGPYYSDFPTTLYEYQWYLNDVPISNATDSVYTPVSTGIYKVNLSLIEADGVCKVFSEPYFVFIPTEVKTINKQNFTVYPNPVSDIVEITSDLLSTYKLILYSTDGRKVISNQFNGNKKIDLSDFSSGIYFLQLIDPDANKIVFQMKLIKD